MYRLIVFVFGIATSLFINVSNATQPEHNISLQAGLWEGISDEYGTDYYLLQLNEDNNHRLYITKMSSAFRQVRQLPFTTEDIRCSASECILSILNPYDEQTNIRLILSPYLGDSLQVLRIAVDKQGRPVLSTTFRLDKKEGKSTVRQFRELYRERLLDSESSSEGELYGFWLGVIDTRNKKQLIVFDYNRSKPSSFAMLINGSNVINETSFDSSDVIKTGDEIKISTSHQTFANQIMLHQATPDMLNGYMYSYHKGYLLKDATFTLFRIKL
jgi:hypothetical protein